MPDALSFTVKYLGSTIVSNNTTATAAVDTILTMVWLFYWHYLKMNNYSLISISLLVFEEP